jgi:hypothetical protein
MDRLEVRKRMDALIVEFRLPGADEVWRLRPLCGLARVKSSEYYTRIRECGDEPTLERTRLTMETQCFVISQGLVDEAGARIYRDEDAASIAEELAATVMDALSEKIMEISTVKAGDAEKNLRAVPASSSVSA